MKKYNYRINNKRPTGLNGHLSNRDFIITSCEKGFDVNKFYCKSN